MSVIQLQYMRLYKCVLKPNFSLSSSQILELLLEYIPDSTVISPRASIAPVNTVTLGFRIARIAAMKNVLSPSSDTIITDNEARKA